MIVFVTNTLNIWCSNAALYFHYWTLKSINTILFLFIAQFQSGVNFIKDPKLVFVTNTLHIWCSGAPYSFIIKLWKLLTQFYFFLLLNFKVGVNFKEPKLGVILSHKHPTYLMRWCPIFALLNQSSYTIYILTSRAVNRGHRRGRWLA